MLSKTQAPLYYPDSFRIQQNLLINIEKAIRDIHLSVSEMRGAQDQLKHYSKMLKGKKDFESLYEKALTIEKKLVEWEAQLIQPNQKTFQDVINFNNMLNAEFMHLKGFVDTDDPELTQGSKDRYEDLKNTWNKFRMELDEIIEKDFKSFENDFRNAQVPVLMVNIASE